MTNPLTTPSGIPVSTPVPRMPDGSPVPKAKAAQMRAREKAARAVSELQEDIEKQSYDKGVEAGRQPEGSDRSQDESMWGPGPGQWGKLTREAEAQLATPEDEQTIQKAYGKTTDELAAEAEKGHNVTPVETEEQREEREFQEELAKEMKAKTEETKAAQPAKKAPAKKAAPVKKSAADAGQPGGDPA